MNLTRNIHKRLQERLKPLGVQDVYNNLMIEAESIGSDNPEGPPSNEVDSDYGARKPRFKTTVFTFPHLEAL